MPKVLERLFLAPPEPSSARVSYTAPRASSASNRRHVTLVENQKDGLKCLCSNAGSGEDRQCEDCGRSFHVNCLRIPPNERFECPACFACSMDPLNEVKHVLFAGYLTSEHRDHRLIFEFESSSEHQKLNLEIRCFRLDGKNNYTITYPDIGEVRFNEGKIMELKPLAENSSLKKRKDDIKVIEKKLLKNNNAVVVYENPCYNKELRVGRYNHFVLVCLVKAYTNRELFHKITTSEKYLLRREDREPEARGGDVEMDKVYVDLKCPLSFQKIRMPVRGRECAHDACVDLESMILLNKSANRHWRCPICRKKSHHLLVCETLSDVLKNNPSKNLGGIIFSSDGTYELVVEEPEESEEEEEPRKPSKQPIVIHIDDSDSDSEPIIPTSRRSPLISYPIKPPFIETIEDSDKDSDLSRPIRFDSNMPIIHEIEDSPPSPPSRHLDPFEPE